MNGVSGPPKISGPGGTHARFHGEPDRTKNLEPRNWKNAPISRGINKNIKYFSSKWVVGYHWSWELVLKRESGHYAILITIFHNKKKNEDIWREFYKSSTIISIE